MITVVSSAAEPVSLDDMKTHLRVEDGAQDALIAALISAARRRIELEIDRTIVASVIEETFLAWPVMDGSTNALGNFHGRYGLNCDVDFDINLFGGGDLFVSRVPLISVDWVKYWPVTGPLQATLDPATYYVDPGLSGRIELKVSATWPLLDTREDAITVRYTAGGNDMPDLLPAVAAIKLLVGHLFENREAGDLSRTAAQVPQNVVWLLAPLRRLGV